MKMPDLSFLLGGWNGGNKASPPAPLRRERGVVSHGNEGSCWGGYLGMVIALIMKRKMICGK